MQAASPAQRPLPGRPPQQAAEAVCSAGGVGCGLCLVSVRYGHSTPRTEAMVPRHCRELDFQELHGGEVRRIFLPRAPVNKEGWGHEQQGYPSVSSQKASPRSAAAAAKRTEEPEASTSATRHTRTKKCTYPPS
jgi:hypothetical protein